MQLGLLADSRHVARSWEYAHKGIRQRTAVRLRRQVAAGPLEGELLATLVDEYVERERRREAAGEAIARQVAAAVFP